MAPVGLGLGSITAVRHLLSQTLRSSKRAIKKWTPRHQRNANDFPVFCLETTQVTQKDVVMTDKVKKVYIKLLLLSESAPTEGGGSQKHNCGKCNSGTFTANILTIS